MIVLSVLIGGALGAIVRGWIEQRLEAEFPWSTTIVNVLGSTVLGMVVGSTDLLTSFIGMGLCGSLTTFSGHSLQVVRLVRDGRIGLAFWFTGVSTAGALIGYALASGL